MKPEEQLLLALGDVGDDLIEESMHLRFPRARWFRALPMVACCALILGAAMLLQNLEPLQTLRVFHGVGYGSDALFVHDVVLYRHGPSLHFHSNICRLQILAHPLLGLFLRHFHPLVGKRLHRVSIFQFIDTVLCAGHPIAKGGLLNSIR